VGWALWACTYTWRRLKNQLIPSPSQSQIHRSEAHTKILVSSSLSCRAGLLEPRYLAVRRRPTGADRRRKSPRLPKGNHGVVLCLDEINVHKRAAPGRAHRPLRHSAGQVPSGRSRPSLSLPSFFYCPGIGASGSSCWNPSCKSVSRRLTCSA